MTNEIPNEIYPAHDYIKGFYGNTPFIVMNGEGKAIREITTQELTKEFDQLMSEIGRLRATARKIARKVMTGKDYTLENMIADLEALSNSNGEEHG